MFLLKGSSHVHHTPPARDGTHHEELLRDEGYETSLQYVDNKQDQQNNQLQNMSHDGAKVFLIPR